MVYPPLRAQTLLRRARLMLCPIWLREVIVYESSVSFGNQVETGDAAEMNTARPAGLTQRRYR